MFVNKTKVIFSSVLFLSYFLPIILLLYVICPRNFRNGLLLFASIVFYAWGAPGFIFVILGTTLLDFFLVGEMHRSESPLKRKFILVLSVCMNLGLLFYFKYCNFFIENLNGLLGASGVGEITLLQVVLPIGISFYTFESLTYVIDVYRRVHDPLKNFWHYQLYIILFPKLIAGPIVRYHEIADQITGREAQDNNANRLAGFFRFVIGLSKKVFIANTLSEFADLAFESQIADVTTAAAWLGVLCYTFQIYFDFSGYSDMAIGLGQMFGFSFPENFNNPYTSRSITEFWQRWHITLGRWMKNYLYIPLGGNRVASDARLYFNLWLVFLASGFWHGAEWTFIFWGIYHGTFLVIERMFLLKVYARLPKVISVAITFFVVMIGWIFFRAKNMEVATDLLQKMFSFEGALPQHYVTNHFIFYFTLAVVFSFFGLSTRVIRFQEKAFLPMQNAAPAVLKTAAACALVVLATATIAASDFNPFIYFRF